MKKQTMDCKVNLIGEKDLSKLTPDELAILIAEYIKGMKNYPALSRKYVSNEK